MRLFEYIVDYMQRHGIVPSDNILEIETGIVFPEVAPRDPFAYWLEKLKDYNRDANLQTMCSEISRILDEQSGAVAYEYAKALMGCIQSLTGDLRNITSLEEKAEVIMEQHRLLKRKVVSDGIAIGIPYLDSVTGGAAMSHVLEVWLLGQHIGLLAQADGRLSHCYSSH